MNDNQKFSSAPSGAGIPVALGFLVGAVVGAGLAILMAPASGRETRRRIADTGERIGNAARNKFEHVRDTANDFRHNAKSALEAGLDAFEHPKSQDARAGARTEPKA